MPKNSQGVSVKLPQLPGYGRWPYRKSILLSLPLIGATLEDVVSTEYQQEGWQESYE